MQEDPHALPSLEQVTLDHGVWNLLLAAEQMALNDYPGATPPKYNDHLIGIRVLGHFLKDFWDHHPQQPILLTAYHRLRREIAACCDVPNLETSVGTPEEALAQHKKLFELGLWYRNHLIRVFFSKSESTPESTGSPSRPSFDAAKKGIVDAMPDAPKTKKDVRQQALIRDGYRCLISGAFDADSLNMKSEIAEKAAAVGYKRNISTQCAYIFYESMQDKDKAAEFAPSPFTMLEMLGLADAVREVMGGQANSLCNVLTMASGLHTHFDRFDFWLEEVPGQPNTYNICSPLPYFFDSAEFGTNPQRQVTFSVDPDVVNEGVPLPPLPDGRLIAIHAACARVAHASGAAEQARRILCDQEDKEVLASNGSTAHVLVSILTQAQAIRVGS